MKINIIEPTHKSIQKVDLRKPVVADMIAAERIVGDVTGKSVEFSSALLSRVGTFDGEKLTPEELAQRLTVDEMAELAKMLGVGGQETAGTKS